jgi:DNA polymerase-3 subunit beta
LKITVNQSELAKKTQTVIGTVPSKTTLPILSTILLDADKGGITLTATDLDITFTTRCEAKVDEKGKVAVPARKFAEIVKSLPDAEVRISSEEERITVKCLKSTFKVNGMNVEEFPSLPTKEKGTTFTFPSGILRDMVARTAYAVSTDSTRPALNGILWELDGDSLTMVATDGHRLAKVSYRAEIGGPEKRSSIIAPKALQQITSLVDGKEDVTIGLAENHVTFEWGRHFIYSRMIEGPFPNYEQVIPKTNEKKLAVNREAFLEAARRMSILSNVLTHQIKLSLEKKGVTLSVETPDLGEAVEEVDAEYDGDPMDIGYNAQYLIDVFRSLPTDDAHFLLDRPDNAGVIRPVDADENLDYLCLLMPLRLSD